LDFVIKYFVSTWEKHTRLSFFDEHKSFGNFLRYICSCVAACGFFHGHRGENAALRVSMPAPDGGGEVVSVSGRREQRDTTREETRHQHATSSQPDDEMLTMPTLSLFRGMYDIYVVSIRMGKLRCAGSMVRSREVVIVAATHTACLLLTAWKSDFHM
jgi:hypothetical protein